MEQVAEARGRLSLRMGGDDVPREARKDATGRRGREDAADYPPRDEEPAGDCGAPVISLGVNAIRGRLRGVSVWNGLFKRRLRLLSPRCSGRADGPPDT